MNYRILTADAVSAARFWPAVVVVTTRPMNGRRHASSTVNVSQATIETGADGGPFAIRSAGAYVQPEGGTSWRCVVFNHAPDVLHVINATDSELILFMADEGESFAECAYWTSREQSAAERDDCFTLDDPGDRGRSTNEHETADKLAEIAKRGSYARRLGW